MVGEHVMDGEKHGGKDALGIGAGLKLPLWQDAYQDAIHSAESELRARELGTMTDKITGKLLAEIALLRDAFRRAKTYRESLVPSGRRLPIRPWSYTVGREYCSILLAQRDLLEFKVREQEACADLEIARARLRETLGGPLPELEPQENKMSDNQNDQRNVPEKTLMTLGLGFALGGGFYFRRVLIR